MPKEPFKLENEAPLIEAGPQPPTQETKEWLNLQACLRNSDYEKTYTIASDLLRQTNDGYLGIESYFDAKTNTWFRDAVKVLPLDSPERPSPDDPKIEGNNALMRALSRLRPIDHVLGKKLGEEGNGLREELKNRFLALSQEIIKIKEDPSLNNEDKLKKIQKLETEFNDFLIQILHQADLTQGCYSQEEAEALLFHYRNLSSLLYPARTMVTLSYDEEAKVLQRETQYPVTKKGFSSEEERSAERTHLESLQMHPLAEKKTAHNSKALAFQEADKFFADYLVDDRRALGAQARKTHVDGPYNAFIVELKVVFLDEPLGNEVSSDEAQSLINKALGEKTDSVWLARSGSPAYLGKGESKESIFRHTQRNLEAIRVTAKEKIGKENLSLRVTILNTDSRQEKQNIIVGNVISAVEAGYRDGYRYMPLNPEGTLHAPKSNLPGFVSNSGRGILHRATRLLDAVTHILQTFFSPDSANLLELAHCASGQDRTGTLVEKTLQEWLKEIYVKRGIDPKDLPRLRAAAGNAAEITTHHIQGSPGMKPESRAHNFFGGGMAFEQDEENALYLKSSSTNKKNKVGEVACLAKPSPRAIAKFKDSYADFLAKKKIRTENEFLVACLEELDQQMLSLLGLKSAQELYSFDCSQLKPETLDELREVLTWVNRTLEQDPKEILVNLEALSSLAQEASGRAEPAWQNLGKALVGFALVSLFALGILAAIPTGGASLLLTLLAANLGTSFMGSLLIGTGMTATALGIGALGGGLVWQKAEKGLAKSVAEFKKALQALHPEAPSLETMADKQERENEEGKGLKLN